ncbi:transporter substrate-binding domain-containing protein [Algoriphagus sediminis]|uniref:Transporter substrate-binding domain-containing protein n=1 Tax=Algoriphagus sediminis TaxID=3057113 RepID=A0ABT7YE76_9BACT|nr:transporter substrate-binding domain-containing protein [Algoriphagus sediminis]MDN3204830.1 transporter substrate-binding domain-containing protein [Algoriphagus sediminis]
MRRTISLISTLLVTLLFGVQCTFLEKHFGDTFKEPRYILDLQGIQKRGFIRAAVDNNTTGFYIYRGRRMGYEYELLRDYAERIGVGLDLVLTSDIQEAFDKLESGEVDIIAMNLEKTPEREKNTSFTSPIDEMNTVLVGRAKSGRIENWEELENDTIYVRSNSAYKNQLQAIRDTLNLAFTILEDPRHEEALIDAVVSEEIDWTMADQNVAKANTTYYDGLDISWVVNEAGEVGWVTRDNSKELLNSLNEWIEDKQKRFIPDLYAKYFLNSKNGYFRSNSPFSSIAGDRISQYDEIIKSGAEYLGWDWRLLSSVVYKESRFDTSATSYAGARGLLQLMPVTLERFGVDNPNDPEQSLFGGVRYLAYLDKFWLTRVPDSNERIKFILASYNVGHGHVEDAWRLTLKYGENTQSWDAVSQYLARKNDPVFYEDPLVKSGYAKGHLAVAYVKDVMSIFEAYKALVDTGKS